MWGTKENVGPMGSAVLTFIDTNGQTDKQSIYIDYIIIKKEKFLDHLSTIYIVPTFASICTLRTILVNFGKPHWIVHFYVHKYSLHVQRTLSTTYEYIRYNLRVH